MGAGGIPTEICSMSLVSHTSTVAQFDDETVQAIMEEALKYEGWTYVYGGDSPSTSFDCSGLVQWCYGKAGIALPRTAQEQYNVTQHIPLSEAKSRGFSLFSTPPTTPEPTSPMWGCMWEITGCTMPEIPLVTQTWQAPTGNSTLPEPDESNNKKGRFNDEIRKKSEYRKNKTPKGKETSCL